MKPLLPLLLIVVIGSCQKQQPIDCGFITQKYLFKGSTPTFFINDLPGTSVEVSQAVYDSHRVGDYYCWLNAQP